MFWQGKKKETSVAWELNRINICSGFLLLYLIAEGRVGLFDGTWKPNFASEVEANFAQLVIKFKTKLCRHMTWRCY